VNFILIPPPKKKQLQNHTIQWAQTGWEVLLVTAWTSARIFNFRTRTHGRSRQHVWSLCSSDTWRRQIIFFRLLIISLQYDDLLKKKKVFNIGLVTIRQRMKDCFLRKCILVDLENLIWRSTGNRSMLMFVFVINTTTLISNSYANRVENFLEFV